MVQETFDVKKRKVKNIDKYLLIKKLVTGFLISGAYLFFSNDRITLIKISDSFFIVGLIYLLIGLFRFTKKLEFYNFIVFGWRKLIEIIKDKNYSTKESKSGEYHTYNDSYSYKKSYKEFILSGLIMLVISIFIGYKF